MRHVDVYMVHSCSITDCDMICMNAFLMLHYNIVGRKLEDLLREEVSTDGPTHKCVLSPDTQRIQKKCFKDIVRSAHNQSLNISLI